MFVQKTLKRILSMLFFIMVKTGGFVVSSVYTYVNCIRFSCLMHMQKCIF